MVFSAGLRKALVVMSNYHVFFEREISLYRRWEDFQLLWTAYIFFSDTPAGLTRAQPTNACHIANFLPSNMLSIFSQSAPVLLLHGLELLYSLLKTAINSFRAPRKIINLTDLMMRKDCYVWDETESRQSNGQFLEAPLILFGTKKHTV